MQMHRMEMSTKAPVAGFEAFPYGSSLKVTLHTLAVAVTLFLIKVNVMFCFNLRLALLSLSVIYNKDFFESSV